MFFRNLLSWCSQKRASSWQMMFLEVLLLVFGQSLPRRKSFFVLVLFIVMFWTNIGISIVYARMSFQLLNNEDLNYTSTLYVTEGVFTAANTFACVLNPFIWLWNFEAMHSLLRWGSKQSSSKPMHIFIPLVISILNITVWQVMYIALQSNSSSSSLFTMGAPPTFMYCIIMIYPVIPFIVYSNVISLFISNWISLNNSFKRTLNHFATLKTSEDRKNFLRCRLAKLMSKQKKLRKLYACFNGAISYPLLFCNAYQIYSCIEIGVYNTAINLNYVYLIMTSVLVAAQITWQGRLVDISSSEARKPRIIVHDWISNNILHCPIASELHFEWKTYCEICEGDLKSSLAGLYVPSQTNILPMLSFSATFMFVFLQFHLGEAS